MAVYILHIILVIITYLIYLMKKKYNYWSNKRVKFPPPLPIVGNYGTLLLSKQAIDDFFQDIYEQFPEEKVVGFYRGVQPVIMIRDPEIVKQILIKDFSIFPRRGVNNGQSDEIGLSLNLFSIDGDLWKILRHKITPIFTSKKLRDMLPLINTCIHKFTDYAEKAISFESDHEIRSFISKYSLDVIGTCIFGTDLRVYSSEKNYFIEIAGELTRTKTFDRLWFLMGYIIPGLHENLPMIDPEARFRNFFLKFVHTVMQQRVSEEFIVKNLMDIMLELKKKGKAGIKNENGLSEVEISDMIIAAQAFIFYGAGIETSSATISYLLYNLAMNQDIQDRLHKDICEVYDKNNGELTYESIQDLTYLQMAIDETMRKHTPLGSLTRVCVTDYTIPGTNVTIQKGTPVIISTSGLHADPKYFPNPEEFNPENFSPENKNTIPQGAYLPFGAGPRHCVGKRFGTTQIHLFIANFLKKFKVDVCQKTKTKIEHDPASFSRLAKDGLWMKITKRD